jgi:hypothetical protein
MGPYAMDDSALQRENRRVALGRRLLSHGVRTTIISRLTGLTRNQLETLRHRLGVPSRTRRRGPTPSSVAMFLTEPILRCEGAVLAALCAAFELSALEQELSSLPASFIPLEHGERLCETYAKRHRARQVLCHRKAVVWAGSLTLPRMPCLRDSSACAMHRGTWAWERKVPELGTSVFVIPGDRVKNAEDRLVVLNRIARSAVEEARGMHPEYVFVRQEKNGRVIPIKKMYGTAWKNARERAADAWQLKHGTEAPEGFRRVRVHDLKHTFGRRLRAAGVSFEDRQDLLGHKSQRITTHYSEAELANLRRRRPATQSPAKFPQSPGQRDLWAHSSRPTR